MSIKSQILYTTGRYAISSEFEELHKQGICWECKFKHVPFCDDTIVSCRLCGCGKSWHPLDGPCRVGPETEFTLHNCYCKGYVLKDNLAYLEWKLNNNE